MYINSIYKLIVVFSNIFSNKGDMKKGGKPVREIMCLGRRR